MLHHDGHIATIALENDLFGAISLSAPK